MMEGARNKRLLQRFFAEAEGCAWSNILRSVPVATGHCMQNKNSVV
jgi:hypothetical protein